MDRASRHGDSAQKSSAAACVADGQEIPTSPTPEPTHWSIPSRVHTSNVDLIPGPGVHLPFALLSSALSFCLALDWAIPHAVVLCWSMSGSYQSATRLRHIQYASDEQ